VTRSTGGRRPRPALVLATLAVAALAARPAAAVLLSESSAFGADTITRDTATGLRWLDLTESVSLGYAQLLGQLEAGALVGYRLATVDEVATLWQHAGIDAGSSDFVAVNYAPIVALAGLLGGALGTNGNCGPGCSFSFVQGWIANGAPPPTYLTTAGIAWFDNSTLLAPDYPPAPIGRASFAQTTDNTSVQRGAWLVELPEPAPATLGATAALALGLSRSARSARRRPRARRR